MDVPKENYKDKLHTSAKALINLIPVVGGTATEVFNALIVPPIEKRRMKWMDFIGSELKRLEENQTGFIDKLVKSEEFVSLLISASQNAFKTHLEEKHKQLRNALFNSIDSKIGFDIKQVFINFIDELSITHIAVLKFIDNSEDKIKNMNEYELIYSIWNQEKTKIFENEIEIEVFRYMLKDLEIKGLIYMSDDMVDVKNQVYISDYLTTEDNENGELPFIKMSSFGRTFISFIETKIDTV